MHCSRCGYTIKEGDRFCVCCGERISSVNSDASLAAANASQSAHAIPQQSVSRAPTQDAYSTPDYDPTKSNLPASEVGSCVLYGLISLASPLLGFVFYLSFRRSRPKTAKVCALVGLAQLAFTAFVTLF